MESGRAMSPQHDSKSRARKEEDHRASSARIRRRPPGLRKSCDFCTQRKRRCDGNGVDRCSLCIDNGRTDCHYSERLPRRSKPKAPVVSPPITAAVIAPMTQHGQQRRNATWMAHGTQNSQDNGHPIGFRIAREGMESGVCSLKRCRMSVSPATGLVGMQENGYLSDFFGCLGFLPLADESIIRRAMVNVMSAGASSVQKVSSQQDDVLGGQEVFDLALRESLASVDAGEGGHIGAGARLSADPSTCILWCAVALGALVRGAPLTQAMEYVKLAKASLAECFDGTTPDTARAFIIMAMLCSFFGDQGENSRYLNFAAGIMKALPAEAVPTSLPNMIVAANKAWITDLQGYEKEELDAFISMSSPLPQSQKIIQTDDLCSIFLAVDTRMTQAYLADGAAAEAEAAAQLDPSDSSLGHGMDPDRYSRGFTPPLDDAVERDRYGDRRSDSSSFSLSAHADVGTAPVIGAINQLRGEAKPEMLLLSNMAERSDIRSGVGGMIYHGNIAVFERDNPRKCLEAVKRCVEVVLRYPGVCRYVSWLHGVHCMLSALAVAQCRELYEQLRAVYNPLRPAESTPAPSFEEWEDMSDICNHRLCRVIITKRKGDRIGPATGMPSGTDSAASLASSAGREDDTLTAESGRTQQQQQQQQPTPHNWRPQGQHKRQHQHQQHRHSPWQRCTSLSPSSRIREQVANGAEPTNKGQMQAHTRGVKNEAVRSEEDRRAVASWPIGSARKVKSIVVPSGGHSPWAQDTPSSMGDRPNEERATHGNHGIRELAAREVGGRFKGGDDVTAGVATTMPWARCSSPFEASSGCVSEGTDVSPSQRSGHADSDSEGSRVAYGGPEEAFRDGRADIWGSGMDTTGADFWELADILLDEPHG